jgi:signal transduction histidine kinase
MERMSQMMESAKLEKEFRKRLLRSQEEAGNARALSSFKGFMISMAAHDFRTILTVLDGYLQCVREKCRDCSVASEGGMLKRASRTVGRLLSMTNTLLDFEAAETGRIRLEIKPFPLHETLRECVSFYEQYAEQKHVDLALCLESTEVMAIGDRERVMEILDNLLYNALKFTPANGKITLSGKKERGFALITVRDSGTGIPEEKLRNIFNPGVMIETLDAHTRFGLGMIICKKLAESQNGKIQVNSILGKGTTVTVTLPSV